MSTNTLRPKRILIGVTGSVAAIKLDPLIQIIKSHYEDIEIKVVATENSLQFFKSSDLKYVQVITDDLEWQQWKRLSDPILHIDLRNWADLIVVAPLSANTLAKVANGLCDNLLVIIFFNLETCILRAWDISKPVIVCPAMNTHMWNHPVTSIHLDAIKSFKYTIISPISKRLACGDVGIGAMAEITEILRVINSVLD